MAQETQSSETAADEHAHPNEVLYIKVALILAVVTAAEVATYYIEGLEGWSLVGILLAMALVKFALVVAFFMHLRFDSPVLRRLFITGVILAIGVYLIVLTTFHVWDR